MPPRLEDLRVKRDNLKSALAQIADMRPGSLVERYRSCGKPTCHCAKPGSRGHGPSWSLTREADGKTITKVIPSGLAVEQTRQQIAEYKRFRQLTRELVEVSEAVCDARLHASPSEARKNGARRGLTRRRGPGDRKPSGS